jgi:hypothetical protein
MTITTSPVHVGRITFAVLIPLLLAVSVGLSFQGNGIGGNQGNANAEYAIGLWGDLPYSAIQATVGVPNMIADMNSQKLAFTVHERIPVSLKEKRLARMARRFSFRRSSEPMKSGEELIVPHGLHILR